MLFPNRRCLDDNGCATILILTTRDEYDSLCKMGDVPWFTVEQLWYEVLPMGRISEKGYTRYHTEAVDALVSAGVCHQSLRAINGYKTRLEAFAVSVSNVRVRNYFGCGPYRRLNLEPNGVWMDWVTIKKTDTCAVDLERINAIIGRVYDKTRGVCE